MKKTSEGTRNRKREPEPRADNDYVVESNGDIFADLGLHLDPEDEFKLAIARQITRLIVERGYTQQQVAAIVGTDQSKISNITRGNLSGFSAERLIRFLSALGIDIDVHLEESRIGAGRVTVHGPSLAVC